MASLHDQSSLITPNDENGFEQFYYRIERTREVVGRKISHTEISQTTGELKEAVEKQGPYNPPAQVDIEPNRA